MLILLSVEIVSSTGEYLIITIFFSLWWITRILKLSNGLLLNILSSVPVIYWLGLFNGFYWRDKKIHLWLFCLYIYISFIYTWICFHWNCFERKEVKDRKNISPKYQKQGESARSAKAKSDLARGMLEARRVAENDTRWNWFAAVAQSTMNNYRTSRVLSREDT